MADYLQSLLANYLTKSISFGRNSLNLAKTVSFVRLPKQAWKARTVLADYLAKNCLPKGHRNVNRLTTNL